jgi:hypothetical protein
MQLAAAPLDSRFRFDIECDVIEKSRPDGSTGRFIGGFVSTDHLDRQGETLIQSGLDFGPFLDKGFFNDNHDAATDALVGYPSLAELRKTPDGLHKGWYVEGELLEGDGTERCDRLWKLARSMAKSGKRKLGFSVEGQIVERDSKDPSKVRKAIVREVAITRCPVNTATSLDLLAKSLSAGTPGVSGGPGDAGPLQPESLEGVNDKKGAARKRKRRIKKSTAVTLLQRINPRLTPALAHKIVNYAAKHYPAQMEDC